VTNPTDPGDGQDSLASVDMTASELGVPNFAPMVVGVLALVVVGGITDIVLDGPASLLSVHVAFEVFTILVSLASAVLLSRGWWRAAIALRETKSLLASSNRSLAQRQRERDVWRASAETALAGFGHAVNAQFDKWLLTPTEREVAFLLLQGHGHKQIAGQTGRSERTVRQHAVAVYQKAGLSSRAELAAFFLQDLMPPETPR